MKCLIYLIFAAVLSSCTQGDPSPELRDEVYKDLQTELEIANKSLDAETKSLENLNADLKKALPQTGQIKFATKKVRDAEDRINTLTQQKLYFEIKIEQRKALAQSRYAESLKEGGRPWPDEKEITMYRSVVKFNRDKIAWEKTKGMKKDVPRGTGEKPAAEPATEASEH